MDCEFLEEFSHVLGSWMYPKDIDAAVKFLVSQLEDLENVVIYGAGSHSQLLWDRFPVQTKSKIRCILDMYPEGKNFPVEVMHPTDFIKSGQPYDIIVLSHFDFESSMQEKLHDLGVNDDNILPVYINNDYYALLSKQSPVPELDKQTRQGRQVIALVTMRGDRKIMNDGVIAELAYDSRLVMVNLDMGRDKTERQDLYEIYYDCQRSVYHLLNAIQALKPDVIYIHDQIESLYFLPRLILQCMPGATVVWEPYDLLKLMIEDYAILGIDKALTANEIEFLRDNERFALENSAGVVYKEVGSLAESVYQQSRVLPSLHFNQYLESHLISHHEIIFESPYKLVYAGTIDPSRAEDVFTGDNYLLGEFELLLSQGLSLDVFLTCEKQVIPVQYQAYQELEELYPDFKIHARSPLDELIRKLSGKFHFGIQIGRCDKQMLEVNQRRYSSTFSAKLWSYIFAGLPIIVNEELQGMAEFVSRYDIGLTVSCYRHEDVALLLSKVTPERYAEMVVNVRELAEASCAEKMSSEMVDFLVNIYNQTGSESVKGG